jgi:hypothetical protein
MRSYAEVEKIKFQKIIFLFFYLKNIYIYIYLGCFFDENTCYEKAETCDGYGDEKRCENPICFIVNTTFYKYFFIFLFLINIIHIGCFFEEFTYYIEKDTYVKYNKDRNICDSENNKILEVLFYFF